MTRSRILVAVALVLCAALCAACAGAAKQPLTAPAPSAAVLRGTLPGLPQDEAEPQHSSASIPIFYPQDSGAAWFDASPACFNDNGAGVIPSAGGHIAYALYEAPTAGCQLQELTLDLTVLGGPAWVALPNYATGRWEFDGPITVSPPAYNFEDPKRYSPSGRVYFGLIAWDGSQVKLNFFKRRIESGDAILHKVADVGTESYTSLANVGGAPGMALYAQQDDALYYAFPTANPPASSQDWKFTKVDSGDNAGKINDLAVVDGKPVIAYSAPLQGAVRFAWCDFATPLNSSDWHHIDIAATDYDSPSIAVVTGQPMLAFFEADSGDADQDSTFGYLRIAIHSGSDMSSGWTHYRAATAGNGDCAPCLNAYNGIPSVCFADSVSGTLMYGKAINSSPVSDFDWGFHSLGLPAQFGGRTRLIFHNGTPIVAYRQPANTTTYAWAKVPAPAAAADWHFESLNDLDNANSCYDLVNINGLPSVLLLNSFAPPYNQLNLRRFLDYDYDQGMGDYTIPITVDGGNDYGPALSLLGINGVPQFCFYAPDGQGGGSIKYGRIAYEMGN